jgi:hypothetical protein
MPPPESDGASSSYLHSDPASLLTFVAIFLSRPRQQQQQQQAHREWGVLLRIYLSTMERVDLMRAGALASCCLAAWLQ